MELIRADEKDFKRLTDFYKYVIENTETMPQYGRWVYGLHPTDGMIRGYIKEDTMFYCEAEGGIIAAVAVTPYQGEDYHSIPWSDSLADGEVSTVHILCVDPRLQGRGIAGEVMNAIMRSARIGGKKAVRLDALAGNLPARRLYEAMGFTAVGSRKLSADNVGMADFVFYEYVFTE